MSGGLVKRMDISRMKPDKVVAGFTLTELLIATAITGIVLTMAGAGLITLLSSNQAAEQRQNRRQELNRALAFIADDIRAAQRINRTQIPNSPTVSASAALNDAKSRIPAAVPYSSNVAGTVALYLEVPISPLKPGETCVSPGIDRITYEARTISPSATPTLGEKIWQGPYVLYRHGRIPDLEGRVPPCSSDDPTRPTAPESRVLVDGLLNDNASPAPSCDRSSSHPAVLSGIGGFYTCVVGEQVALMLRGDARPNSRGNAASMADAAPVTLSSSVFQRSLSVPISAPTPTPTSTPDSCKVPDLVGDSIGTAKSSVSNSKLMLIYYAVVDPTLTTASQKVASQSPAADTRIPCDQPIIVTFTYAP
jgi:prepilin-type N-terminal cleavage/methylation domain-containing protein